MIPHDHWRYQQRCPAAVVHADRRPPTDHWYRCSGLVICHICGREYYDHPPHPVEPYLTVTCDGKIVKLLV